MIDAGVPCDAPDESGMTALMEAALQGHTATTDLLLRRVSANSAAELRRSLARVNCAPPPNSNEKTLAATLKKFERLPGRYGCTALIMASSHGHVAAARTLLKSGANWLDPKYDALDGKGRETLLAAMAGCGEAELFGVLASAGGSFVGAFEDAPSSTAALVLKAIGRTAHAMRRAKVLRASRPTDAELHSALANRIQLAATALLEHLCIERSKASGTDDDGRPLISTSAAVDELFQSASGAAAMALAVRTEAKIFLSQPVMQEHVQRMWLGEVLHTATSSPAHQRRPLGSSFVLLLLLAAQLPLVPILAVWPPLQQRLVHSEHVSRLFLLDAPLVKFCLYMLSDILLAAAFTLSPAHTLVQSSPTTYFLGVWICAGLLGEGRQVLTSGVETYASELFNWFDVAGLLCALVGLLDAGEAEQLTSGAGPVLRALACLFLWLRIARLLLASPTFGPFVLMVFRMVTDLLRFLCLEAVLLLAYTSATYKLYEGSQASAALETEAEALWDGEPSCDAEFATFGRTLTLLWEGTLKSEGYFRCVQASSHPEALYLMYSYVILTVRALTQPAHSQHVPGAQ